MGIHAFPLVDVGVIGPFVRTVLQIVEFHGIIGVANKAPAF